MLSISSLLSRLHNQTVKNRCALGQNSQWPPAVSRFVLASREGCRKHFANVVEMEQVFKSGELARGWVLHPFRNLKSHLRRSCRSIWSGCGLFLYLSHLRQLHEMTALTTLSLQPHDKSTAQPNLGAGACFYLFELEEQLNPLAWCFIQK